MPSELLKLCSKCANAKPLAAFNRDARLKSGLKSCCKSCDNATAAAWRKANPEAFKNSYENWRSNNKQRVKETAKAWYDRDPEARTAHARKAYRDNKAICRKRNAEWCKANRAKRAATCAKYLATKLQRTPAWADLTEIAKVYAEARALADLGLDVHVDHVIPLQGKLVSGLHVHNNLRVILAAENVSKGNKLLPEFAS